MAVAKKAMLNAASCSRVMTQYYDEAAKRADCSEIGPKQQRHNVGGTRMRPPLSEETSKVCDFFQGLEFLGQVANICVSQPA